MRAFVMGFIAVGIMVTAAAQAPAPPTPQKVITLHLSTKGQTRISPLLYGINYDWNAVPGGETTAFSNAMLSVAHTQIVRYPGGWNAEKYNWSNNTEIPWRHFSPIPGATADGILQHFPQASFITPSAVAIQNPAMTNRVAQLSEQLVSKYGDRVKIWEIGNEWFLQRGAKQHPEILQENLSRYAMLLNTVVPRMKAANPSIHIYVVAEWNSKKDAERLRQLTRRDVWAQIDGIAIHPYCGMKDDASSCALLQQRVAEIQSATHKHDIYSSEWAVVRNHTEDDFGIRNANYTLMAIRNLAMAGVEIGAYWPPVREIPALAFVSKDFNSAYPTGIVFGWMSEAYEGVALRVTGDADAAAARNNDTITVFVPSGEQGPELVRIDLTGMHLKGSASGTVLFSEQPDNIQTSWKASQAPLSVKLTTEADGKRYAEFSLDPATPGRGSSYEIARIALR